jgi:hypothetical protein
MSRLLSPILARGFLANAIAALFAVVATAGTFGVFLLSTSS